MGLLELFKSKNKQEQVPVWVDMHSHILPGIDDGAADEKDSITLIKNLSDLGYKKLIATPHIMGDFFKNTPEIILGKLSKIKELLEKENIKIEIEAAAEYYLDEWFMKMLTEEKQLLSFGKKYLLFETSYINEPSYLAEAIFKIKTLGYKPVLAHPERYTYLYTHFNRFEELYEKGVLFQININSLSGYYSKPAQKFASQLVKKNMVDFVGTDCHGIRHIDALIKSRKTDTYSRLLVNSKLLNNSLLE